jgi:hypothetical protein
VTIDLFRRCILASMTYVAGNLRALKLHTRMHNSVTAHIVSWPGVSGDCSPPIFVCLV